MLKKISEKLNSQVSWKRNSLLFTVEGAIGAVILNLIGPFVAMFAKRMGAGDFQIGLLSSVPALIGILALIPGALMVDRQSDKKKILGLLIILSSVLFPLAAATPYLGKYSVIVYIGIIGLMNWPASVFNISWQSFFSDVFSLDKSHSAFAKRSRAATLSAIITLLAGGLILTYLPGSENQRVIIYQLFYTAAFILSILQIWILWKVRDYSTIKQSSAPSPVKTVAACFKNLWSNTDFRSFVLVVFIFHIAWQMAWPLFFIFQVDYLHANEAWISYIQAANGFTSVITFSFWSRLIERKGANWVLIAGALGLAVNPFLIVNSPSLLIVVLINVITGLTFSAFQLGLFQNLLEVVPQENKTLNIAVYTTLISISGFISPLVGVFIYKLTSIHFAMTLSSILRLCAAGLFILRYRSLSSSISLKTKSLQG